MIKLTNDKVDDWKIDIYPTGAIKLHFGKESQSIDSTYCCVTSQTYVYADVVNHIAIALGKIKKDTIRKIAINDEYVMAFIGRYKKSDGTIHHNNPNITLEVTNTHAKIELANGTQLSQKGKDLRTMLNQIFTQYEIAIRPNPQEKEVAILS